MIKTDNISFKYPKQNGVVFSNISLEIGTGEICAVLGRNGIGKTTMLKCLIGLLKTDEGTISKPEYIAYVPQKIFSVFDMPVIEMIVMGRVPYMGMFGLPKKQDYAIAKQCAEKLSISHLLDKHFLDISGGQKQMVLIARALCLQSKLLIFDEPMSALDFNNQNHVLNLIKEIVNDGISVIFSTHDPTHATHISDKTLIIKDNEVNYFGETKDILTNERMESIYEIPLRRTHLENRDIVTPLYDL